MKHTPGPWKVGTIMEGLLAGTVVVTGKNGNSVNSFGTGSDPECAANAYLIAAAPEMYEALRWLLHLCSGVSKGGDDFHVTDDEWNDAWKSAISAITKAEGVQGNEL